MPDSKPRSRGKAPGRVRIVGGAWRRRQIAVPTVADLRPTPDRVRETLFNWLGQNLDGLACLDLYAGSGVLGFEAASRGAARVLMVEKDRVALAALERSRAALGASQVSIIGADAPEWLARPGERFDVVFLDPPFRQNALPALLERLPAHLVRGARVYTEGPAPIALAEPWHEMKRARAGQVHFQLLQWGEHDRSGLPRDV